MLVEFTNGLIKNGLKRDLRALKKRKDNGFMRCEYCGKNVELPFQCGFCQGYFCIDHRLPENHKCQHAPPRKPLGSYQTRMAYLEDQEKRARAVKPKCALSIFTEKSTLTNLSLFHPDTQFSLMIKPL